MTTLNGLRLQEEVDAQGTVWYVAKGILVCYLVDVRVTAGQGPETFLVEGEDLITGIKFRDELVLLGKVANGKKFYIKRDNKGDYWINLNIGSFTQSEKGGLF